MTGSKIPKKRPGDNTAPNRWTLDIAADPRKPDNASPTGKKSARKVSVRGARFYLHRILLVPLVAGLCGLVVIGLAIFYYTITLPHPMIAGQDRRPATIRILGFDGALIAERGLARDYIPLDLLPRYLPQAVLATEDRRFYHHFGIDVPGLVRATLANFRARRYVQGGSTITQQLAKNLFLRPDRALGRKLEEMLIALWLEARLSKAEILELYLNRVYFGAGAHGVEAATQRYFGKSARDVTLTEAAVLAGLLKAPTKYSPVNNPGLARSRARVVLRKMQDARIVSASEARAASAQSVRFVTAHPAKQITGVEYAVDWVMERLPTFIGGVRTDLTVETTLDLGLQKKVQSIVRDRVLMEGEAVDASQAAGVVLDLDGAVRALVGGRSYVESQYNRAVKGRRQPGSAFKPFVYLAALEAGLSPTSIVVDEPIAIKGWSPRNFSGTFRGAVTLKEALAQSINTVAVHLYMDIGKRKVVACARRLGITSELLDGPSLALGASEVTPYELTQAFVPFANGGLSTDARIINRVISEPAGTIIYERKQPAPKRVIEPAHVSAMNEMMRAVLTEGTGRQAAIGEVPFAGKTGTSQDFRDAWFVGYSGHYVTGVWVGNDTGRAMHKVSGGSLPARIWRDIMVAAHAGQAAKPLIGILPPGAAAQVIAPGQKPEPWTGMATGAVPADRIDEAFLRRVLGSQNLGARNLGAQNTVRIGR